jgi:hypothetical protein
MLKMLRKDLTDLRLVAEGEIRSTNRTRDIQDVSLSVSLTPFPQPSSCGRSHGQLGRRQSITPRNCAQAAIIKGEVPDIWKKYPTPPMTVNPWVADYVQRCNQLVEVAAQVKAGAKAGEAGLSTPVWMGAFFMPGAFLTATQQSAAKVTARACFASSGMRATREMILSPCILTMALDARTSTNTAVPSADLICAQVLESSMEQLKMIVDVISDGEPEYTEGAPAGSQYLVTGSFLEAAGWAGEQPPSPAPLCDRPTDRPRPVVGLASDGASCVLPLGGHRWGPGALQRDGAAAADHPPDVAGRRARVGGGASGGADLPQQHSQAAHHWCGAPLICPPARATWDCAVTAAWCWSLLQWHFSRPQRASAQTRGTSGERACSCGADNSRDSGDIAARRLCDMETNSHLYFTTDKLLWLSHLAPSRSYSLQMP